MFSLPHSDNRSWYFADERGSLLNEQIKKTDVNVFLRVAFRKLHLIKTTMLFVVGVFYVWGLFEYVSRRFKLEKNLGAGAVHEEIGTRVGTLIVATIYLQLIQNRYMFRRFTVLQCSHQHCVQPVASDVEVVGYL